MKEKLQRKTDKFPKVKAKSKAVVTAKKAVRKAKKKEIAVVVERFGLHSLKVPVGAHKHKKMLGRGSGSGHGKTSTRGSKGQTSRAGRHFYSGFEGGQTPLIRRMPKRGFTSKFKKEYQLVNLDGLNKLKEASINPKLLEEKGLIKDSSKLVKILGDGEIKNAVIVQAHAFSKRAAEEIKKAGGKIEVITKG
jgi:large subunit ribosomal protein L15